MALKKVIHENGRASKRLILYLLDALVYHNDPVGSTSERSMSEELVRPSYTIMTLWGQLQNYHSSAIVAAQ